MEGLLLYDSHSLFIQDTVIVPSPVNNIDSVQLVTVSSSDTIPNQPVLVKQLQWVPPPPKPLEQLSVDLCNKATFDVFSRTCSFGPTLENEDLINPFLTKGFIKAEAYTVHKPSVYEVTKQVKIEKYAHFNWITLLVILTLFIVAWLRLFYNKVLINTFKASFNDRYTARLYEDQNAVTRRVGFALNVIFILITGLYFFLILDFYGYTVVQLTPVLQYLSLCGLLLAGMFLRIIILKILGWITLSDMFDQYKYTRLMLNKASGLIVFPLVMLMPYVPINLAKTLSVIVAGILIIFYLFALFRGIWLTFKINLSFFYTILYICTLEIIPLLLIYRAVSQTLG